MLKKGYPYGTDRNRLDNLGINRSTNWYMTGPNISNNGEMTWSQISGNRWTGNYLALINLCLLLLYIILNVFLIRGNYG